MITRLISSLIVVVVLGLSWYFFGTRDSGSVSVVPAEPTAPAVSTPTQPFSAPPQ